MKPIIRNVLIGAGVALAAFSVVVINQKRKRAVEVRLEREKVFRQVRSVNYASRMIDALYGIVYDSKDVQGVYAEKRIDGRCTVCVPIDLFDIISIMAAIDINIDVSNPPSETSYDKKLYKLDSELNTYLTTITIGPQFDYRDVFVDFDKRVVKLESVYVNRLRRVIP